MRAKKHLGQNFLKAPQVVRRMVGVAEVDKSDTIVEVGPGKGVLTEALLNTGATVIAFEKDGDLIKHLSVRFKEAIASKQLTLIADDVLSQPLAERSLPTEYKLVANIPYYITGELLRFFLSSENQPTSMTLMVQKEVAERVVARDGKESVLSLSVKVFGDPHYIEKVPARYFSPAPKVDSAILHVDDISRNLNTIQEETFFRIVKKAFLHRRKVLKHNLRGEVTDANMQGCAVDPSARAEDIALESWLCLAKRGAEKKKEGAKHLLFSSSSSMRAMVSLMFP